MSIRRVKNGRAWAVLDADGTLIALVLYKRGALEILKRLSAYPETKGASNEQV